MFDWVLNTPPNISAVKRKGVTMNRIRLWSSSSEVFCNKGVLRNFTKFTGKHLCQSLFFNKVASLRPATLLKKRLWRRCFPVNFVKFLRTPFHIEHLWWLLLKIKIAKYTNECELMNSAVKHKDRFSSFRESTFHGSLSGYLYRLKKTF